MSLKALYFLTFSSIPRGWKFPGAYSIPLIQSGSEKKIRLSGNSLIIYDVPISMSTDLQHLPFLLPEKEICLPIPVVCNQVPACLQIGKIALHVLRSFYSHPQTRDLSPVRSPAWLPLHRRKDKYLYLGNFKTEHSMQIPEVPRL